MPGIPASVCGSLTVCGGMSLNQTCCEDETTGKGTSLGLGQVSPQTSASLPGFVLLASPLKTVIYSALTLCARHFLFKMPHEAGY